MVEWQEVKRSKPEVVGYYGNGTDLVWVTVQLEGYLEPRWTEAFRNPKGVGRPLADREMKLEGSKISMALKEGEIKRFVKFIDDALAYANKEFRESILPKIIKSGEKKQADKKAAEERLERMRKEAEGLYLNNPKQAYRNAR